MPILATVTQGLNKVILFVNFIFLCLVWLHWLWLCFLCVILLLQFFTLLPPLYELILEIERGDIRGGQLLNLLHKKCHCGVPELQTCIQRYVIFFIALWYRCC
jgi:hypothetical protein